MTYNFLDNLVLTEDRTIRDEAYARVLLGQAVQRHDSEYIIEKILTCGKDYWEHELIFSDYMGKWNIAGAEIMRRLGHKIEEAPAKEPLEDLAEEPGPLEDDVPF